MSDSPSPLQPPKSLLEKVQSQLSSSDPAQESELMSQVQSWLDVLVESSTLEDLSTGLKMFSDVLQATMETSLPCHLGLACQLLHSTFSFCQKCEEHLPPDLVTSAHSSLYQIFQLGVSLQKKLLVSLLAPGTPVEAKLQVASCIPSLSMVAAALDTNLALALWKSFVRLWLSLKDHNMDGSAALESLGDLLQRLLSTPDLGVRGLEFVLQVVGLLHQSTSTLPLSLLTGLSDLCRAVQLQEELKSSFDTLTAALAGNSSVVEQLLDNLAGCDPHCHLASHLCSQLGRVSSDKVLALLQLLYAVLQAAGRAGRIPPEYSQLLDNLQTGATQVPASLFHILEQILLECVFSRLRITRVLTRDLWVVVGRAGSQELALHHCLLLSRAASGCHRHQIPPAPLSCLSSLLSLLDHTHLKSYWSQFPSFFHPDLWLYLAPSSSLAPKVECEEVIGQLFRLSEVEKQATAWWLAMSDCQSPRLSSHGSVVAMTLLQASLAHGVVPQNSAAKDLVAAMLPLPSTPAVLAVPCLDTFNQLVKCAPNSLVVPLLRMLSPAQKADFEAFLTAESQAATYIACK